MRLKHAYFITCRDVVKDPATGEVVELMCTYDPETRGGDAPDGRKVKGTLHWVSAKHAVDAEVRLFDHLLLDAPPEDTILPGEELSADGEAVSDAADVAQDLTDLVNPDSLEVLVGCKLEPSLASAQPGTQYQFLRTGYFTVDSVDSGAGRLIFNRSVGLRDSWAKIAKAQGKG